MKKIAFHKKSNKADLKCSLTLRKAPAKSKKKIRANKTGVSAVIFAFSEKLKNFCLKFNGIARMENVRGEDAQKHFVTDGILGRFMEHRRHALISRID